MAHNLTHIYALPVVVETSCFSVTDDIVNQAKTYKKKKALINHVSEDSYVLNNPCFRNLEKIIDEKVENYKTNVLQIRNNLKKQNSWLAFTSHQEKHHVHAHPGVFVSAVFYIKCSSGNLLFRRPRSTIQEAFYLNYDIIEYNPYNCTSWQIPLKTGDLAIFLGHTLHGSTPTEDDERIILGVNYSISGQTGNDDTVDYLELS